MRLARIKRSKLVMFQPENASLALSIQISIPVQSAKAIWFQRQGIDIYARTRLKKSPTTSFPRVEAFTFFPLRIERILRSSPVSFVVFRNHFLDAFLRVFRVVAKSLLRSHAAGVKLVVNDNER
jgi:hypothetical protein